MVLPTRRSSVQQVTMEGQDTTEQGGKRTAGTFPGTPHPQKRMRCKDNGDTPPTEETATEEQAAAAYDESVLVSEIESPGRQDEEQDQAEEQQDDDDIDWDKLAQSEPARTDIPIFLAALGEKEAADDRLALVLDEAHQSLLGAIEALLTTVANVHNMQRDRLEAMEADIKHNLVCNDQARAQMQVRLQESAHAAQGLFAKLLERVTAPIQMATTRVQQSMEQQQQQQQQQVDESTTNANE